MPPIDEAGRSLPTTSLRVSSLDELLGDPTELDRPAIVARMRAADAELCQHAESVAALVELVVSRLADSSEEQQRVVVDAAWLHDIGKLVLPQQTLQKAGPLSDDEWVEMRRHPEHGASFLERSIALKQVAAIVRQHHEWHDGRGYPNGLTGDEIVPAARLIGIADAYDAMTSLRPYRATLSDSAAIDELRRCAGSQFDPHYVELFVESTHAYRKRAMP
jgi:putative nucleotidyltransferase with HDIG domain